MGGCVGKWEVDGWVGRRVREGGGIFVSTVCSLIINICVIKVGSHLLSTLVGVMQWL